MIFYCSEIQKPVAQLILGLILKFSILHVFLDSLFSIQSFWFVIPTLVDFHAFYWCRNFDFNVNFIVFQISMMLRFKNLKSQI